MGFFGRYLRRYDGKLEVLCSCALCLRNDSGPLRSLCSAYILYTKKKKEAARKIDGRLSPHCGLAQYSTAAVVSIRAAVILAKHSSLLPVFIFALLSFCGQSLGGGRRRVRNMARAFRSSYKCAGSMSGSFVCGRNRGRGFSSNVGRSMQGRCFPPGLVRCCKFSLP